MSTLINTKSHPRYINALRWTARIWSLLLLLLAIMISIVPEGEATGTSEVIPVIEMIALGSYGLSVVALLIAWRWEMAGGVLAILGVASHDILFYIAKGFEVAWLAGNLIAGLAFIIPAALFIICWALSRPR